MNTQFGRGGRTRRRPTRSVGFFGILGSGNIGNDASFESLLGYVRNAHPDVILDALCAGPERVRAEYGIDAAPYTYRMTKDQGVKASKGSDTSGSIAAAPIRLFRTAIKIPRVGLEVFVTGLNIAGWVRRHDAVIVPGMGVLEATLPVRPWATPYHLFVLSLSGRIFRTKVAFVSVGADPIRQRLTQLLCASAAKLALYRSYRDEYSRDVMRHLGVGSRYDRTYPDLAFGIPPFSDEPGDSRTVGLGVMEYYGSNDDRAHAEFLYRSYLDRLKLLVRQLIESDRNVRLFVGDVSTDLGVIHEIVADVRAWRPDLPIDRLVGVPVESFADVMKAIAPCGSVIAARFHNVLCALLLAKPTIATGYAKKHANLMAEFGMSPYYVDIRQFDEVRIIKQLDEFERKSGDLRALLKERRAVQSRAVADNFAQLSKVLF